MNVLEHFEDDRTALRIMSKVIRSGGVLLLLAPALTYLYGSLDRTFGHWRRYSKDPLVRLLADAGLSVRTIRYVNMLGALAWFATGKILRRNSLSPFMVRVGDSVMIPIGALLEAWVTAPFGQSLVVIAEKPGNPDPGQ